MATGNLRNKVSLKPGYSLVDWIRLSKSGEDLTGGYSGKLIEVTPRELAEHNKRDDCWVCVNGKVFNVTRYLDFHPGGVDELMRGSGKDATELFNKTHPWVNFNGMLKSCLIGQMKPGAVAAKAT